MSRRALKSATASLAILSLLAACGSDDDDDGAAATTATTAGAETPSPTAAESPAADTSAPDDAVETTSAAGDTATPTSAASSAEWDAVLAAASEEGKVVMYSVMVPDINDRLTAAFEAAYPDIDLEIIRVPGNEIDAKLDAEEQSGSAGADAVANVNYPWVQTALADGRLAELTGPDATGPDWSGTEFLLDNRVQLVTFTNIGIASNTNANPDGGPTSYEDLLDPAYGGGKIGLPDPIAPVVADFYATLQDNYGEDVLDKLAAQQPVFFPGAVPLEQSLAAGEITVGGYVTNIGISAAAAQGAPVEFTAPENAWVPPIMSYIPTWGQNPNAAQVLLNFMATREGQEVLGLDSFSPLSDIPGTAGAIEDVSIADIERITEPGWYDTYYAAWKQAFGR